MFIELVLCMLGTLIVPGNTTKIKTGKVLSLVELFQDTWGRQTTGI